MPYQLQALLIMFIFYLFYSITYPSAFPETFGGDDSVVQSWRAVMVLAAFLKAWAFVEGDLESKQRAPSSAEKGVILPSTGHPALVRSGVSPVWIENHPYACTYGLHKAVVAP